LNKKLYNDLNRLNIDYFEKIKLSIQDPLGLNISNDVNWIKLDEKWKYAQFPVVISGSGKPVVFLHGFDSSFLEFRRIYPFLKNKFQLIIPDLLGFGFTPRIATNEYNPHKIISNLLDIIKTLTLKNKIMIVGASMGGSVAINLAKEIPNLIDKIILLSPAGLFGESKIIPFPLNQIGAKFLGLPQVRKSLCRQAFAYPEESVGSMEEQIASIHLGCSGWENSLASFAKSGGFAGTYKHMPNISIKTICGENDRILGKKEINKIKQIDNLNFIGLKNCGHLPHVDLPSLTGKIIYDYFCV